MFLFYFVDGVMVYAYSIFGEGLSLESEDHVEVECMYIK